MKIEKQENKEMTVLKIRTGECFLHNNSVYMRLVPNAEIGDKDIVDYRHSSLILELQTGVLFILRDTTKVIRVDATLKYREAQ